MAMKKTNSVTDEKLRGIQQPKAQTKSCSPCCAKKEENILDVFTKVDKNGLTFFHRAASMYSIKIFEEAKEIFAENDENYKFSATVKELYHKKWMSGSQENFGVSPLTIALVDKQPGNEIIRQKFIEYLINDFNAEVNNINSQTLWTPFHWAARHGDYEIVKLMIEKGAKAFTPDSKGFFPIHLAGYFQHKDVVQLLLKHSIESYKSLLVQNKTKPSGMLLGIPDIDPDILKNNNCFLASSMYATVLLFWAVRYDGIDLQDIKFILTEMESYPEAVVPIGFLQTSIHSAALNGNVEIINLLCEDFAQRHQFKSQSDYQASKKKKFMLRRKINQLQTLSQEYEAVLKIQKLKKLRKQQQRLWDSLLEVHKIPISFALLDKEQNTPLHLAAMKNNIECEKVLTQKWRISIDVRNAQGVMSKNMGSWFKETDQYFKDYYTEVDQMLCREAQADQEIAKNNGEWLETQATTIKRIVSQDVPDGLINQGLMQCRAEIPQLPSIVLRCQAKTDAQQKHIDFLIRTLDANKFCINMFQALSQNQYYITLNLDQNELEKEAILSSYEVKLSQYNVKVPFNINFKQFLSPFVSKDIQVLTLQRFTRLFNINDLKNDNILLSVFSMQDENDLFFVDKSFTGAGWQKYVPHFILKSTHYIYETFDGKQRFKDLVSLSNYFGEKDALARGFFLFYSVWIIPIMLFAVGITIHQFVASSTQTYTEIETNEEKSKFIVNQELDILFIFAIFVQIFSTVMIEFWKRKEKHIEFVLGRSIDEEKDETKLNPNYQGFRKISWTKFDTTKEEDPIKKRKTRCYSIILVLSSLFLLGVSVAGYVGLNQRVENGLLRGFLLNLVTTLTSQLQLIASRSLIELSNIKYEKDRSQAFMISMMSFRLVNVNLPLVYAICTQPYLDPNDFTTSVAAQYSNLYFLILGAIGTQCAGVFYGRYLPKYVQFKISKWFYFCKVRKLAQNQIKTHQLQNSQLSTSDANQISSKASKEIFKDFLPDYQPSDTISQNQIKPSTIINQSVEHKPLTQKNNNSQAKSLNLQMPQRKKKGCCAKNTQDETYQRFVLKSEFTALNQKNFQILIDAVEVNNLMMEKTEQSQISDLVEKYVIYSLGLLYCGVCPAATIIVFLFFTIDPTIERYMDCNVCKRTQPSVDRTLHIWTLYAEAIIIAVVVSNTLLLYQATNTYEHMLQGWFGVPDYQVIWYIILIEHLVIGFLLIIKFVIPDMPRELTKMIQNIKLELDRFHGLNVQQKSKKEDIVKVQNAVAPSSKNKDNVKDLIKYYNKNKSEIEIREGRLADFLKVDPRENNYYKIVDALDDALKVNLEIRMFRETFLLVERSILQRKMQNFIRLNKSVLISCVECSLESATQFCADCGDHFCASCCQILHKKSAIFQKHQIASFGLNPRQSLPPINQPSKSSGTKIWRKFEYFNFPLNPHNQELFRQIQVHFEYLKRVYIKFNYINDQTGKIDIAAILIDQNYDSLEREMGGQILKTHVKEFGWKTVLSQKEAIETKNFNDEELFLLNRLAFRLFKKSGSQVRFELFIKDLTTLQNGPFDQRLNLWLRSINELEEHVREYNESDINLDDDHLISRTKFTYMVNASFPQDLNGQAQVAQVIDQIFGSDAFLQMSEIQSLIIKSKEASDLMYCVLQIDPQETQGLSTSHSVTSMGLIDQ